MPTLFLQRRFIYRFPLVISANSKLTARWKHRLAAEFGYADVTAAVEELVARSGVTVGIVVVALTGSTGAVTTIEFEPGALNDLRRALDRIASVAESYEHNTRWGDGNGFSHVRSALLKTSISIPIIDGKLTLGTWQQIVVINLDNRAREREIVAVVCDSR
jgi:secondary thiamine-phosphate synthase enzyme